MFTPQPIGFVSSPYKSGSELPKGLGARHEADGSLKILPEFEPGLTDIEGFSHLVVLWEFDRSQRFELLGTPPLGQSSARSVCHPLALSSESNWSDSR